MKKEELFHIIGEADEKKVASAGMAMTVKKRATPVWLKWSAIAMVACLCLVVAVGIIGPKPINTIPPDAPDEIGTSFVADAAPMVYVNDTLYKQSTAQISYAELKEEFVYLGEIEDEVKNDQSISDGIPNKDFQANTSIVGSKVYQHGDDIVVQINERYWLYECYQQNN